MAEERYGQDVQGPELPDYDEDLDEDFIGPSGLQYNDELYNENEELYDEANPDYSEQWQEYEEDDEEPYADETLPTRDGIASSPVAMPIAQAPVDGGSASTHQADPEQQCF